MAHTVTVQQLPSLPLAVVRRTAKSAELHRLVPECCGLVWKAVRAQGARGGRHVAVYWDASIRLEVGVELLGPFTEGGEVVRSATPAGWVASITHLGSYSTLDVAHSALRDWCSAHQHPLAGPSWEIYGHWQDEWNADPSKIRTDIFYQVAAPAA